MKRNLSRLISTVLALVMLFTVASASAEASAILGSKIQYDTSKAINNGEDIEIEFWYWTGASDLFKSVVNQYTAIHPNVKITLVENPYDDYWTKLPLALQGSNGPAIFNVHNSHHENLINYLAPYDIPVEDLEEDFVGVSAHVIDGKVYYTDYGMMTATMYYNKAMWSAAGLTEADIPTTWDQFREVAKKLTIRDEKGELIQAGFSFNGGAQGDVLGMQYQYGQNLFTEDGKVTFNNDAIKTVVQRMKDIYEVDGSGDYNFGNNSGDNFGQGMIAMYLGWGFMHGLFQALWPETEFGSFEIPTPTEDVPYAYHRYNGESTFGINKNAPADQQAVAQEFVLANSIFPAKKSLANDSDILSVSSIAVLANHIDRYIWPGPMPSAVENNMKIALENIFYNGEDVEAALQNAEDACNEELASSEFVPVESSYAHADEAK